VARLGLVFDYWASGEEMLGASILPRIADNPLTLRLGCRSNVAILGLEVTVRKTHVHDSFVS
jgi:hypothetical protein